MQTTYQDYEGYIPPPGIEPLYYSKYRDLWYRYDSINDRWHISNCQYDMGTKRVYCAKRYRIDQIFDSFKWDFLNFDK